MFAGSHQLMVDDKGRLAIPARFRQPLSDLCGAQLVITKGPNPCLEIYPAPEFLRIVQDIQAMEDRHTAELLKQVFVGFAVETEMDKQGRVLLPPMLRKRTRLDGAVVLMGQDSRFDVWPQDVWETRFGENSDLLASLEDAFRTLKR
ncbi:division/cell wall cluster transcriptional repressor MraZ [Sinimarinibacterium sp. CAU 1509]|uniref:division/cell wall cluster transcriptional repressor MraZ n=1 Tax=Sinimarinibacterium sp. CAU 1509 TaxID=2562283 RepID=UPI0010AD4862|nr:division/cell wall cluster transcriptional repressor MraZ [Sinimarinibacterium sp. CAU 1509]TJY65153.1 division/cell wall cluster transcriptional repressor MraZ [Sinimarinibacterium sp. CAU 1509]